MIKISSSKLFLALLAILILLIFSKFSSLLVFPDSNIPLEKGEAISLKKDGAISQKFVANRDNLSQIHFLLRESKIKDGNKISAALFDESCTNKIAEHNLELSFLSSDNLFEFNFPAIKNSADETFCIKLSSLKTARFFTVETSTGNFSLVGPETGQTSENRSLSIRPVYSNDHWWQNISELNQRISQYKPWFLKHYFLYVIAFGFLLLSIAAVILLILI